ncbi:16230_t:CDS:2, partial [Cetraspora pellucida]
YYNKATDLKNAKEIFKTGYCYRFGLGVNNDIKKAVFYFKKAVELKHPKATFLTEISYDHREEEPDKLIIVKSNELITKGSNKLKLVNDMNITFDQIQKIELTTLPKLFMLYWDIESCSTRGPEFLPIGEEKDDYVYMIQMDLCLLNKFINAIDQKDLLLKFAELFGYLQPDFEIGYNTGSYDWNFVLRKSIILGIEEQFVDNLLNKKKSAIKYYIRETTVRVVDKNIEEKMQKYEFAGININNRKIKVNPMENRTCEYFHLPRTVFLDLLIWVQKTFLTALSNTLNNVLVRCELLGKVDLPYVPDKETKDLDCMFIYITAIKYRYNITTLNDLSLKLSNLTKIDNKKILEKMQVSPNILEEYAFRKGRIEITKYGGGLVIPPEMPSIEFLGQFVPIADVDFGLEYPNVIINSNISNDTCVDINSNDPNFNVITDNFIVYGKYKTHYVMEIIKSQGCNVIYSDTNSVFYTLPTSILKQIYNKYKPIDNPEIKKQFWTEMIEETIRFSKELQIHINEVLKKETRYSYMASVLGFKDQKEILMNDDKSIEQIISEVVKKYINKTDLKLFKLTDKYNPNFKHTSLTDFANKKFQPIKKGGNTKVINFVTRMQDDYKIEIELGRFYYYILTHQDNKAQIYEKIYMCTIIEKKKEEAEQFLEVIYNENLKYSKQSTLVDCWNIVEKKLVELKLI